MSEIFKENILSEKKRPDEGKIFGEPGEKKEKEPTREEKIREYISDYTNEGKCLKFLDERPNFSLDQIRSKENTSRFSWFFMGLKKLEGFGVVEIEKGLVKKIHWDWEKLEKIWEKTRGAKILELVEKRMGEEPFFITPMEISKTLNISRWLAGKEVDNLRAKNLVIVREVGRGLEKRIYSTEKVK